MSDPKLDLNVKLGENDGHISSDDSPSELSKGPEEEFKPDLSFRLAFASLCVITLMAALDATSISVALPVSRLSLCSESLLTKTDYGQGPWRYCH